MHAPCLVACVLIVHWPFVLPITHPVIVLQFLLVVWDRTSLTLYSSGCCGTHCSAGCLWTHGCLPASASRVMGLQAWATVPAYLLFISKYVTVDINLLKLQPLEYNSAVFSNHHPCPTSEYLLHLQKTKQNKSPIPVSDHYLFSILASWQPGVSPVLRLPCSGCSMEV